MLTFDVKSKTACYRTLAATIHRRNCVSSQWFSMTHAHAVAQVSARACARFIGTAMRTVEFSACKVPGCRHTTTAQARKDITMPLNHEDEFQRLNV